MTDYVGKTPAIGESYIVGGVVRARPTAGQSTVVAGEIPMTGTETELVPTRVAVAERRTFTATGAYAYRHNRGSEPNVTVTDSTGKIIECCVTHTDVDTVLLHFGGTLTNAVLILN